MNDPKLCRSCRFWKPVYFETGFCTKCESPNSNAKMFVDDGKARILTHITFGCVQHELQPLASTETL